MTTDAILMCARCRRPTLHVFAERRPLPTGHGQISYVALLFECDRCSTLRVWGSEPSTEPREAAGSEALRESSVRAHATRSHGLRRRVCPACGGVGLDCSDCDDEGRVWEYDSLAPCSPRCPLAWADADETLTRLKPS